MFKIFILLLILFFSILWKRIEKFIPYWNYSTRSTRNMSYDLRCQPYIEPEFINFQYPTNFPNDRYCLYYNQNNNTISL